MEQLTRPSQLRTCPKLNHHPFRSNRRYNTDTNPFASHLSVRRSVYTKERDVIPHTHTHTYIHTHTHTLRGMELNPSQLSCFLEILIFCHVRGREYSSSGCSVLFCIALDAYSSLYLHRDCMNYIINSLIYVSTTDIYWSK